ncbi:hypothetical protein O9992_01525 [Vibrio lentus]|nr:hypothetical protein [Vibrio lentus]
MSQARKSANLTHSYCCVVDQNNKIVHIQRVPELTVVPDLNKAVEVAKSLLNTDLQWAG